MEDKKIIDFINEELRSALYPTEEELKHQVSRAVDNMEIGRLQAENRYLKEVIRRQNEILEIFRKNAYVYLDEIDITITDKDEHFKEIKEWSIYGK